MEAVVLNLGDKLGLSINRTESIVLCQQVRTLRAAIMAIRFILTEYVNQAIAQAIYDKLEMAPLRDEFRPVKE